MLTDDLFRQKNETTTRHSFGTYRHSQLRSEFKNQDPKDFLKYEMGTGVACLDKNYIAAKVKPKQVEKYFSITA